MRNTCYSSLDTPACIEPLNNDCHTETHNLNKTNDRLITQQNNFQKEKLYLLEFLPCGVSDSSPPACVDFLFKEEEEKKSDMSVGIQGIGNMKDLYRKQ